MLSSHTIALRKAFQDCSDGIERLRHKVCNGGCIIGYAERNITEQIQNAKAAAEMYQKHREEGISDVCKRLNDANGESAVPVDVINVNDATTFLSEGETRVLKPRVFKQRYCVRNVPCIIRGLSATSFSYVSSQWCSEDNSVDVNWFCKNIGGDTIVPVRIANEHHHNNVGLDADGRAVECETDEMTLYEWIRHCQQVKQPTSNAVIAKLEDSNEIESLRYLKDWHLLQFLSAKKYVNESGDMHLYTVPSIFERDLLNNFLTRYYDADFRFVYWGPFLHSDVLHSFSWSYNVVGKKRWIFYIPDDQGLHFQGVESFELIQETGEAIFVPAKWKHEVVNLVETLSINHNFITSANIDYTYECLLVEILSIEKELVEWGIDSDDDFEMRENMLRGCVGLDVSMFIIMTLCEVIVLLNALIDLKDEDLMIDYIYSIFRMRGLLFSIMSKNSESHVNLIQRLSATLHSYKMASEIIAYLKFCFELTDTISNMNELEN